MSSSTNENANMVLSLAPTLAGVGRVTVNPGEQRTLSGSSSVDAGVTLADYGTLTNTGFLSITGELLVDPATFVNQGTVTGAVTLGGGSYLYNAGTIFGGYGTLYGGTGQTAVYGTTSPNTVVNKGTIAGDRGTFGLSG